MRKETGGIGFASKGRAGRQVTNAIAVAKFRDYGPRKARPDPETRRGENIGATVILRMCGDDTSRIKTPRVDRLLWRETTVCGHQWQRKEKRKGQPGGCPKWRYARKVGGSQPVPAISRSARAASSDFLYFSHERFEGLSVASLMALTMDGRATCLK